MRIKSLMKNKKAFSAIIAALILMLIAVAAGVVVYAYVMGWIGGVQTNPPGQGIIVIDSINANATTNMVDVYVRNVGTVSVTVSSIYIDDVKATVLNELLIPTANVEQIAVTPGVDLVEGGSYLVKVVCTDGTTTSATFAAQSPIPTPTPTPEP